MILTHQLEARAVERKLIEETVARAAAERLEMRIRESEERTRALGEQAHAAALLAEQANRSKDEFLATVSHELRTPLNAIVGWSSMLRSRELEPGLAKAVSVIYRNAQAQAQIIEDILDVSRIATGKLRLDVKATDLVAVAREAIETVKPLAAARSVSIECVAPPSVGLLADPDRLQQVVWNLLTNAVKFTDAGGNVRVSIACDAERAKLEVTDTGRGIEPELLSAVFDRFMQVDSSSTRRISGLGLGLSLVRHIVELHGGSVAASSEGVGHGTTFKVVLPVRRASPVLEPERASLIPGSEPLTSIEGALSGLRILLVEDERDARELLEAALTEAGASVVGAASVAEAFSIFPSFRPQLLVSDIAMPDEDGYSFIRRIRTLGPELSGDVPALALTAFARGEDRAKALRAGFDAHLGKPVMPSELIRSLARMATAAEHAK
ncbi:MAG: ATP-binding protein [Polyangiaceae bacterium]